MWLGPAVGAPRVSSAPAFCGCSKHLAKYIFPRYFFGNSAMGLRLLQREGQPSKPVASFIVNKTGRERSKVSPEEEQQTRIMYFTSTAGWYPYRHHALRCRKGANGYQHVRTYMQDLFNYFGHSMGGVDPRAPIGGFLSGHAVA